jgi:hypothetical protein
VQDGAAARGGVQAELGGGCWVDRDQPGNARTGLGRTEQHLCDCVAGVSVWAALSMPVRIGLFALMAHPREKSSFSCTLPLLIELLN